jgi:hypothetical protein
MRLNGLTMVPPNVTIAEAPCAANNTYESGAKKLLNRKEREERKGNSKTC